MAHRYEEFKKIFSANASNGRNTIKDILDSSELSSSWTVELMADKNASTRQDKAISSLELGFEGLKLSTEENKVKFASLEATIQQLAESNKGLKQDFQDLLEILKREPPPLSHGRNLEAGEGSSYQMVPRSKDQGKSIIPPHPPTRFGTLNDVVILDEHGRVVNASPSVNQVENIHFEPPVMSNPLIAQLDTHTHMSQAHHSKPSFTQPQFIPNLTHPLIPYNGNSAYTLPPLNPLPNPYTLPTCKAIPTTFTTSFHQNHTQTPVFSQHYQQPAPTFHSFQTWSPYEGGVNRSGTSNTYYKPPKVEFPKFDGKDPRSWVGKCEKYFQLNPTLDARNKVICAALYLEGEADVWYRSLEEEKPNMLWPEFANMVCNRFSKAGYENLVGQFNKLTQKGRVEDYITQFDELRGHVMTQEGSQRESYYIDTFISGLK